MSDETLFATALEQPDPAARAAYLDSTCPDPDTRKRLDALLAAHDKAGDFMARPAVERPVPESAPTRAFAPDADHTRTHGGTVDTDTDDALGFLATPRRPDSLGRIGHYEVLEVLGRGGFGIVFRAFDETLQRVVAVKVLAPSMAATSPARKRFLREARHAGNVRHENVVQIHDISRDEERLPYLVMEFIPGETLQQRLDRTGPLEVSEVLRIGKQIAAGLASAHEMNLVHRDIKPSNILIDSGPEQRVKITDFGLARAADDASISQSGVVAGTPMYMAPEQAKGEALDHRADLFSLGSVLYVMCSGRPPFRAGSTLAVLKRVVEEQPRPIREIIPEVPDWLCRIIDKLHAKDPAERYQNAKEVAEVLADCEKQMQTNAALTDYSRIPGGKPEPFRPAPMGLASVLALILGPILIGFALLALDDYWPAGLIVGGTLAAVIPVILIKRGSKRRSMTKNLAPDPAARPVLPPRTDPSPAWSYVVFMFFALIGAGFFANMIGRSLAPRDFDGWNHSLQGAIVFCAFGLVLIAITIWRTRRHLAASAGNASTTIGTRPPSPAPRIPWLRWVAAPVAILLLIGTLIYGRAAMLYISDRGELQVDGDSTVALIVLRDGEPVAEWSDTSFNRRIELPPGQYTLKARSTSSSHRVSGWRRFDLNKLGGRGGSTTTESDPPYDLVVEVKRGRRVIVEPVTRSRPMAEVQRDLDSEALQGDWVAEKIEFQGKPLPEKERLDFQLTFTGGKVRLTMPGGKTVVGTFRLDASRLPREIDIIGEDGKWVRGVYHPHPIICIGEIDGPRPTSIGQSLDPNSKQMAVTLRRPSAADASSGGFVPLFNGKDLSGWKVFPANRTSWKVENGVLVGSGKPSHLFTERGSFSNFHLRMETRVRKVGPKAGAVGVYSRVPFEDPGMIISPHGDSGLFRKPVPKLYDDKAAPPDPAPPTHREQPLVVWGMDLKGGMTSVKAFPADDWFTHELVADGASVTIKTAVGNHSSVSYYIARAEDATAGHIALQLLDNWSVVEFRKIEIKELPASPPADSDLLQGKWDASAMVIGGRFNPLIPGFSDVTFRGNRVTLDITDINKWEGTFTLDPKPNPKAIDIILDGEKVRKLGIYRLEGEQLTLCLGEAGEPRPTRFDSGDTALAVVFRRAPAEGWDALFNGTDLAGWRTVPDDADGSWAVREDVIQGKLVAGKASSQLVWTGGEYRDFHLRAEARAGDGALGGILFRWEYPKLGQSGTPEAYDAVINSNHPSKTRTGSLYHLGPEKAVKNQLVMPDVWFTYEIIARGGEIEVKVNGQTTVKHSDPRPQFQGARIALALTSPGSVVQFRKIEIKELTSTSSGHGQPIAGWGSAIDPKRDCKFDLAADALTITVPAGKYNLNPTPEFNNLSAPRVLRNASGDFQFEARVDAFPLPQAGPTGVKDNYVGAGLVVWQDERNFVRFVRAGNGETSRVFVHLEHFRDGRNLSSTGGDIANRPVLLRATRRGDAVRFYWSADGATWREHRLNTPARLADKLQIGVCAINTTQMPLTARFSQPRFQPDTPSPGGGSFVPLFNGKDLTGWTGKFPNAWSVDDGILIGRGKNGSDVGWSELVHPRSDFQDFHLRAQARISAKGWAGIRVRKRKDSLEGYKVWLSNDPEKTGARTGRLDVVGKDDALTITNPPDDLRVPVDEWFTVDLVARGPELVLSINGQESARVNDSSFARGEIQLEVAGAETIVQFRKIEIKELPLAPPVPALTDLDRADLAKLQGEWDARLAEFDGKPVPIESGNGLGIRFRGGDFEFWVTEKKQTTRQVGTFRVEAANKQVLLYFKDQIVPVRVAYRVEGDRLRLNFAGLLDTDGKPKGPPLRIHERSTSMNNLKQLAIAMHNYDGLHKALPTASIASAKAKGGKPLLSWRVALLPWLQAEDLYKQFKLDEPWDSEHNKKLIAKMPAVFATPGISTPERGMTHYRVFAGPGTAFEPRPGKEHGWPVTEILDGSSSTLLIVEATDPVTWTKPDDLAFDPKKPLPKLGVYERATHVAMCDGKVHALVPNAPEETIRALATRNGGESVSAPVLTPAPDQAPPFYLDLRRRGSLPAGAVLLRTFNPAKDKAVPVRGDAKEIVSVEDGSWRIENAFDPSVSGNFRVALGSITDGIPEDGILICRAKVKLKPNAKNGGWGDLELNAASPSFHGYDWPDHLATYRGEITEWAEKEVRYPVDVIRKKNPPTITVHVGLHGNGVLWVKDVELLHLPAAGTPPVPAARADPAVLQPLRDLVASTAKSRDMVKARFGAGTANKIDLLVAEAGVVEARIRLAEAEGNRADAIALHEALVAHRKEERDLIAQRVELGRDAPDVLSHADARLADAKVRLAKLKPHAPAAPAPRPKP